MGSKLSMRKPFTFPLIILSLSLILLILRSFRFKKEVSNITYSNIVTYPEWYHIIARELAQRRIRIGLVNVKNETGEIMGLLHGDVEFVKVDFEHVADHIQWTDLFPEWIDEEKQKCPEISMPQFEDYGDFDVVVAQVPCPGGGEKGLGSRDVFRLQVNLVVANLVVRSGWEYREDKMKYVVFMGSCGPMWEIFRCDDLLWHEGFWSIYKPDLRRLKQKVLLPIGTCQLARPFAESGEFLCFGWAIHFVL